MTDRNEAAVTEAEPAAETRSVGDRRYLRPREIAAYILTAFGQKNLNAFVDANRQFFMISFLGLSGSAYGLIMFFETIYDALDDSISGLIIDRTRTRYGRLRPYLLLATPVWSIAILMLFTTPSFLQTESSKVIWAIIAIFMHNLGMSYFGVRQIMLYNITPNIKERNNLIATAQFMELFGMWLPSLLPIFVTFLPKLNPKISMQSVYSGYAYIMVAVAAGTALYGFTVMRERVPLASREKMQEVSIWDSIKAAFSSRPMFVLILATFFNSFKSVGGASESFFWLHNTGKLSNGTIAGLFTGIPNYIITPLAPKLVDRFGAKRVAAFAGIFGGIAYTTLFLTGFKRFGSYHEDAGSVLDIAFLAFMLLICGLPNCLLNFCNQVLTGDVYDYGEWKTGVRNEALIATVTGYFQKLANSVTGLLSGLVITLVGYTAHKDVLGNVIRETQDSVLLGFFIVFTMLPAFARFMYGIVMLFFPVTGKFKQQMQKDLEERRLEAVRAAEQTENIADEE